MTCLFHPDWKDTPEKAEAIANVITEHSGIAIKPRIADNYPQILSAVEKGGPILVYAGSFIQAIISVRKLGTPFLQIKDGSEFYGGVMIHRKAEKPQVILSRHPDKIAYAMATSSGESSAMAATGGRAGISLRSHTEVALAVSSGTAMAGFVKDRWWSGNSWKFKKLAVYEVPGISERKNPDNILSASMAVDPKVLEKIGKSVIDAQKEHGFRITYFTPSMLHFSLYLMRTGNINPLLYKFD